MWIGGIEKESRPAVRAMVLLIVLTRTNGKLEFH
jgi:hypothetical protein